MKIAKSISLGILAALGALILELTVLFFVQKEIEITFSLEAALYLSVLAIIEELMKFFVIYESYQGLETLKQSIKNAFFIGLGFAASELFLKNLSFQEDVIFENTAAFLFHIVSSVLFGLLLFKKGNASYAYLAGIISLLSLVHLSFNLLLTYLL